LGENVKIYNYCVIGYPESKGKPPRIGDNTKIGSFVEIGNDVEIGRDCLIGSGAKIFPGTKIGNNVFVGPGAMFLNDKSPEQFKYGEWICDGVVVEDEAVIGGGAIILPGVRIGRGAIVGAGSVVLDDVIAGSIVVGNPAHILRRRNTHYSGTALQHLGPACKDVECRFCKQIEETKLKWES